MTLTVLHDSIAPVFPARFRFRFLGLPCAALAEAAADGVRLQITADLGPIPFTAESPHGRALRLALFELDAALSTERRFAERQGRLCLLMEARLPQDCPPARLVAAAVALVLRARPELMLAAETSTAPVTARRIPFRASAA